MAPSKSNIWKYFRVCGSDNEHKAECENCEKNSSLRFISRGKCTKSYSTKPLWNHLRSRHPTLYKNAQLPIDDDSVTAESSGLSAIQKQISNLKNQPTIEVTLQQRKMWELEDPKAKEVTTKICEMMALDAEPFSLVEREGFKRFMKSVLPRYPLPNRTHFSKKVMPEMYEKISKLVREELSKASSISFTTDIWTNSTNNESFISLTCHFISTPDYNRHNYTLNTKHFPTSHTGEHISDILNQCLEEWKITPSQTHLIVRDTAPNMRVGTGLMTVEGVSCFIHKLQLVVHDAILDQRAVKDIISKCRKIVTHFGHSSIACSKLKLVQENLKLPCHKLVQDVSTRWNSTYYMLERLYEQKKAVTVYAAEHDIPTVGGAYQWGLIENIIRVLKPFEELTKEASCDKEIISYVIPAVATLRKYLSKRNKDCGVQKLKDDLKKALERRFYMENDNIEKKKYFTIATFLDPRYKDCFLKNKEEIKNLIVEELFALQDSSKEKLERKNKNENQKQLSKKQLTDLGRTSKLHEEIHEDIWDCFEELAKESHSHSSENEGSSTEMEDDVLERSFETEKSPSRSATSYELCQSENTGSKLKRSSSKNKKKEAIKMEMGKYAALPLILRNSDPIQWWKSNNAEFPNLSKLVVKYLGAPPSSVSSERLFSAAGQIYRLQIIEIGLHQKMQKSFFS